jgi:hypothetical protein
MVADTMRMCVQGIEVFRSEVEKRMPNGVLERAAPEDLIDKTWERRDYLFFLDRVRPVFH